METSSPSQTAAGPTFRALLVGVDAYPRQPLYGCVNDIDAIQRVLLDAFPPAEPSRGPRLEIRRLASPHPGVSHDDSIPSQPATLANLRAALARLAEEVQPGDQVFIYYSGHGARTQLVHADERTSIREAMAPVDVFDTPPDLALLYDFELDEILGRIAARTLAVTCILDCCHSAGVARDVGGLEVTARCLDLAGLGWPAALPAPPRCPPLAELVSRGAGAALDDGIARTLGDWHVVAACLNHEGAYETTSNGRRYGRLTCALVRALRSFDRSELPKVAWGRIWQGLRAEVESHRPQQHLWMGGNPARAVLAGPPVDGDAGLAICPTGDAYEIAAGTLASVTRAPSSPSMANSRGASRRSAHLRISTRGAASSA